MLKLFTTLLFCLISFTSLAGEFESIFDYNDYYNVKLSPDGQHLAVSLLSHKKTALLFLERESMQLQGSLRLADKQEIGNFHWVNNERVVIEVEHRVPYQNKPVYYGELYAVNFDGSRKKLIYGYAAGEMQTGTRLKKKESTYGWAELVNMLPQDDRHILISSTPMNKAGDRVPSLLKLDVYRGIIKKHVVQSPVAKGTFITDKLGRVKAVVGTNRKYETEFYVRDNDQWQEVAQSRFGSRFTPIAASDKGSVLYALDDFSSPYLGLYKYNFAKGEYKEVYTPQNSDVSDVELAVDTKVPYALRIDENYPAYLMMNKKQQEAKTFKDLLKTFPYNSVNITSRSKDGQFYIVHTSSDVNPGTFYLYNKPKNELKLLFRAKSKFKAEEFTESEPIKFVNSDKMTVHGFFTPAHGAAKDAISPLVVLVHGGPHGIREIWRFSSQVQYLSHNGFAVLQVNYRGSSGYGSDFQQAGFRHWGDKIQQDIFEGYQWLIKQGKAKANQACIMGASFGGYSAVQSAIKYPNTYRCAVANAGVYDLNLMYEEGDIQLSESGVSYLTQALGEDQEELAAFSPVNHVEKIQIPLFLAHGKQDKRAPFEHFEKLQEALDKAGKSYFWFTDDRATHGFYTPENQKMYMTKVVNFLHQNLD